MDASGFLDLFLNVDVAKRYLPQLLHGAWVTVSLSVFVVLAGLALGMALALVRLVSPRPVVWLLRLGVDCFRAAPPLAFILLIFFGLPSLGITLSAYWVLWLVLTAILAAFAEEIYWAGISSIHKGQWEAARSTGLSQAQAIRLVVLPQAFKLCVPPLTNRAIAITKNTALGTAIGMPELLNEAQTAQSFSGNATPLILASLGYLLIFIPMMMFAARLEKRMRWGTSR